MNADLHRPRLARWLVPAIYCGSLAAFAVDLTMVNTLPFGVFYVPLVGSAIYRRDRRAEWILAAIACAMIFVGSFSPSIDPDTIYLAIARAVSIAAVLGTATLVHWNRDTYELCDTGQPSSVLWERSGEVYHATIINRSGEARFFLAAEPTGRSWHWAAWRPGSAEMAECQGQALTVQQAMQAAERAARKL